MLDTLSYSENVRRDLHADRLLEESLTFTEGVAAGRLGWFTRLQTETLALTESITASGEGIDFGEVAAALKKLIRIGKEYCLAAYQFATGYATTTPTDTDPDAASYTDLSKRYPE